MSDLLQLLFFHLSPVKAIIVYRKVSHLLFECAYICKEELTKSQVPSVQLLKQDMTVIMQERITSDTNLGPGHIYPKRVHMKIAKGNKIREPMLELV